MWEDGISDDDNLFFKLYKILVTEGRESLIFLLKTACPKDSKHTYKRFLLKTKDMSWEDFKKKFDISQGNILKVDKNGTKLDISLLCKVIPVSCDRLTPELEDLVAKYGSFRNKLIHNRPESNIVDLTNELQDLIEKTYVSVGNVYSVDVTSKIKSVRDKIDVTRNATLPVPDITHYRQELKKLREHIKDDFKTEGQNELISKPDMWTLTDAASFISGKEYLLKVDKVYTRINLLLEEPDGNKADVPIRYENILTDLNKKGNVPDVLILEGDSGSGKTTLTKKVYCDWLKCLQGNSSSIVGLNEFDLIFPYECSNSSLSSYVDLIKYLLPKTSLCFRNDDILNSAKQLKILFMVDAADDLHPKSKDLLRELIEHRVPESDGKFRILCTTRPHALEDLKPIISKNNLTSALAKITGISPQRRKEFVRRLHEEMRLLDQSTQETQGLLDFLSHSQGHMGDQFKLPLILTLLTYLWAEKPKVVNRVKTVSSLYIELNELILERLSVDLSKHEMKTFDIGEIRKRLGKFQKVLNKESLMLIGQGAMVFLPECKEKLEKEADHWGLPHNKVFSAFMSIRREQTSRGYDFNLAAPHKSLMEHKSASHIIEIITGRIKTDHQSNLESKLTNHGLSESEKNKIETELNESKTVVGVLKNNHAGHVPPMSKYQNVLIHLIGLLTHQAQEGKPREVLHRFQVEIIDLLKLSRLNTQNCFHIVSEANCDSEVAKTIGNMMKEKKKEEWHVNDSANMRAAVIIMTTYTPKYIRIDFQADISSQQDLQNLLSEIAKVNCEVSVKDAYSWRELKRTKDSYLHHLLSCEVKELYTAVVDVKMLPSTVSRLHLGILKDDANVCMDPGFQHLTSHCTKLTRLGIHLTAGSSLASFYHRLPDVLPYLYISGVTEDLIGWMVDAAQELQPSGGYSWLTLPSCQLCGVQLVQVVERLSQAGVVVEWRLEVSRPGQTVPTTAERDLVNQAAQKAWGAAQKAWGQRCDVFWYTDDEHLTWW